MPLYEVADPLSGLNFGQRGGAIYARIYYETREQEHRGDDWWPDSASTNCATTIGWMTPFAIRYALERTEPEAGTRQRPAPARSPSSAMNATSFARVNARHFELHQSERAGGPVSNRIERCALLGTGRYAADV